LLNPSSTYFFNSATIDNINSNAVFRLTFTTFLCIGEFIYTTKEAIDLITFIATKLIKSNVCFMEDYNYLILRLKWSKIDTKHKGVSIIVIAIVSRNPTAGASIGEPRALIYTSRIAYVSYARVYHLFTPSTLTINRVTSCRLLKYIYSAATVPRLITLYYAFFYHRHLAYD
jgi:hypothetical protein